MKQICTLVASLCLLIITQSLNAQTASVSTTAPVGITFGTPITVSSANGFTSTNTTPATFNVFAKGRTDTIVSPSYYYPSQQSTLYFNYSFSSAKAMTVTPVVAIVTSSGDTIPVTTSSVSFSGGGVPVDYYITVNLPAPVNNTQSFKIVLGMPIANSDKAITAYTVSSNAILGTPPAEGSLPLPVTFAGFYAKNSNGYTSLTWNVATESNLTGYEVQRSIDGSNFSKIGFAAATNSSSYSFVDSKSSNVVYYRIKSIDIDGKYSYSIIINIKGLHSDVVMKAFPMPVQNELTVQHSAANSNSKLEILSADGRIIRAVALAEGSQQTKIDLSSAKSGIYVVRFVNGLNIQTSKIVKQ